MPFTPCHAAAAVPFVRCRLVLSALVAGSLAPDFLYFVTLSTSDKFGHTLPGAFLFSLPAALGALWLFHRVLKQPLLSLFPENHRQRLAAAAGEFRFGPPRRFLLVVASVLVGVFTHVIWDAFTHSYGWFVAHFPVLTAPLGDFSHVRVYMVLQHGSTLVGAALLAFWYVRWLRRAPACHDESPLRLGPAVQLTVVAAIMLSAGVLGFVCGLLDGGGTYHRFFNRGGVAAMSVAVLEVLAFSIFWHFAAAAQQRRPDRRSASVPAGR